MLIQKRLSANSLAHILQKNEVIDLVLDHHQKQYNTRKLIGTVRSSSVYSKAKLTTIIQQ